MRYGIFLLSTDLPTPFSILPNILSQCLLRFREEEYKQDSTVKESPCNVAPPFLTIASRHECFWQIYPPKQEISKVSVHILLKVSLSPKTRGFNDPLK